MIHYLTYLKDSIGQNYLGIEISNDLVSKYLEELKEVLGKDNFEVFTKNQQNRDKNSFHITVINVPEYNNLSTTLGVDKFINSLDQVLTYPVDDIKMLGIGQAQRNENKAYFVVCQSEKLNKIREFYSLPPVDLHITIGFNFKDVHGVRKNEVMAKDTEFFKMLKAEYLEDENFDFVKNISNFESSDSQADLIPVFIDQNKLKIKCGDYIYVIGLNDENKQLFVTNKYKSDKTETRIPQTEIIKKFM